MNRFLLFWLCVCTLISCKRTAHEASQSYQEKKTTSEVRSIRSRRTTTDDLAGNDTQAVIGPVRNRSLNELKTKAMGLALIRTPEGTITKEGIAQLEALAPDLADQRVLMKVLSVVPEKQLPSFKGFIIEYLQTIGPGPGMNLHPEYEAAVYVASQLNDRGVAAIFMQHLPKLPAYYFPEKPIEDQVSDVVDSLNLEHLSRGIQGQVARHIVMSADNEVIEQYRDQIGTAPRPRQRVMIWALGESPDIADFELLWSLRGHVNDPGTADTLKRALNAIPGSMARLARYRNPGLTNRDGKTREELETLALECRARLKAENMLMNLAW